MKLCKDCVHFRPGERYGCHRPYLCPVDGSITYDCPTDAYEHRAIYGCCGPDGRYWIPQQGHDSDCAIYRAPAFEPEQCNCSKSKGE